MDANDILEISKDGVFVLLEISLPVMLVALVVGLIISLVQALTQIQEMTLSFVPKIVAVFISLIFLMPFMIDRLTGFAQRLNARIISGH